MSSLERMEKILVLLEAHSEGITGQELAEACGVPWSVMKKDLETLSLSAESRIPLYTDSDETEEDNQDSWPDTRWFMDSSQKRYIPLHLTVQEALEVLGLLEYFEENHSVKATLEQKLLTHLDMESEEAHILVKGNMAPQYRLNSESFALLENAINRNRKVEFHYNQKQVTAEPLGLVYYSRLRQWYLIARASELVKNYNLSNMDSIRELSETFSYPAEFSLKEWLAPRWGMEFGEPMQVKVKFSKRSQTFAKVRKDVAHRHCVLREEDGGKTLVLEDTVIGKNEFIAWVLGFGSAAEVLEPIKLRLEIRDRVRETLSRYK